MKKPAPGITEDLDRIDRLLEQSSLFSLTMREKETLKEQSKGLREKYANIEGQFLTVGFLGGTGVGKSSLLNALADREIASSSYRRPHTERVLIYRHVAAEPLPKSELRNIPWQEVTHEADGIKALLLCDLPDFDSILTEHRSYVMAFLEHLDLLVWVTSPEKYADLGFYKFLEDTPKAPQYYIFVLNKLDLLMESPDGRDVSDRIERVLNGFRGHLENRGMENPLIFAVSAKDAMYSDSSAHWNQFHLFRRHLFEKRNIKTVTAIKSANLEVAVKMLSTPFEKERMNLAQAHVILMEALRIVREKRSEWDRMGRQTLLAWVEKRHSHRMVPMPGDLSPLVGPGYVLGLLLKAVKVDPLRMSHSNGAGGSLSPEETIATLKTPFMWLQERLHQRFLRENMPPRFWEEVRDRANLEDAVSELGRSLSVTAETFEGEKRSGLWGFRVNQYLVYGLLTVFLLAALPGENAWRNFFNSRDFMGFTEIFVSGITALFSPRGLASLLSYALMGLFFAIYFYRRYVRKMKALGRRYFMGLAEALVRNWTDCLENATRKLELLEKDVGERKHVLSSLCREDKTG